MKVVVIGIRHYQSNNILIKSRYTRKIKKIISKYLIQKKKKKRKRKRRTLKIQVIAINLMSFEETDAKRVMHKGVMQRVIT